MSTKPSKKQTRDVVINYIASFAIAMPSTVDGATVLQKPPLRLTAVDLGFLAKSLRAWIQAQTNGAETIYATELRRKGLTVDELIAMVWQKVQ